MNLPLRTSIFVCHRYFHFYSIIKSFKFFRDLSFIQSWDIIFCDFVRFLLFLLLVIPRFNLSWSNRLQFLYQFRFTFLYVYVINYGESCKYCWAEGIIFCVSVKPIWFMMLCSSRISLFSHCLDDLTISKNGVSKTPTIPEWESICDFSSSLVTFMNLGTLVFVTYL